MNDLGKLVGTPPTHDPSSQTTPKSDTSATSPSMVVAEGGPLSIGRLRSAFAAMLKPRDSPAGSGSPATPASHGPISEELCETNPRSIVEALLFVGRPDNGPLSARELAAAMRNVSASEVEAVIQELNRRYEQDGSPYIVVGSSTGYRLELLPQFDRARDRYFGRVREARLSPAALEVLSIVAYHQPVTVVQTNELRGKPSGPILATLVRRQLLQIDRPEQRGAAPRYSTTPRFLRLFGLESLAALPQNEELAAV